MLKSKKDVFNSVVLLFIVGSFLGALLEEVVHVLRYFIKYGSFDWKTKVGLLYGHLSPIYGIATVLLYLLFCFRKRKWYVNFILASILCGAFEFIASVIQEKLFNTISWDYSKRFLNIGGRTTIPYMIIWGLLSLLFIYKIFPFINKIYMKIPKTSINIVSLLLFAFLVFDISITVIALNRQMKREEGIEAVTYLDKFCDEHYPDKLLNKVFYNAKKVSDKNSPKEIKLVINNKELTVELIDNISTSVLIENLKLKDLVINMSDYNNFEKVGDINITIPETKEELNLEAGDVILYNKKIAIYYDSSKYKLTKLGRIKGISKNELKELLGSENVTVTFKYK